VVLELLLAMLFLLRLIWADILKRIVLQKNSYYIDTLGVVSPVGQ
jgi:hypothetical protein